MADNYLSCNLALVDVTPSQKETKKDNNKVVYDKLMKWSNANMIGLSKRITLKAILKRRIKSLIDSDAHLVKKQEDQFFSPAEMQLIKDLGVSQSILDVPQRLENTQKLLAIANDLHMRKLSLQELVLGKGKGLKNCFDV